MTVTMPVPRIRMLLAPLLMAILAATAIGLVAAPTTNAAVTCQRTFTGDATGRRDVTSSLTSFIKNHGGRRLCLKSGGTYRVDGIVRIEGVTGLRFNGRGASLRAGPNQSADANRRQLYLLKSSNIFIHDLNIRGSNPNVAKWVPSRQSEHGVWIDGGSRITLSRMIIRGTYGDGVYLGFKGGDITPATNIKLRRINTAGNGRSGISITAGNYISISGSTVSDTALHGINLEPDYEDANIHHVSVSGSTIRRVDRAPGSELHGYAFAANGKVGNMTNISVTGSRSDRFEATVYAKSGYTHRSITFRNNYSTRSVTANFGNIVGLSFGGNTHIRARTSNVR